MGDDAVIGAPFLDRFSLIGRIAVGLADEGKKANVAAVASTNALLDAAEAALQAAGGGGAAAAGAAPPPPLLVAARDNALAARDAAVAQQARLEPGFAALVAMALLPLARLATL